MTLPIIAVTLVAGACDASRGLPSTTSESTVSTSLASTSTSTTTGTTTTIVPTTTTTSSTTTTTTTTTSTTTTTTTTSPPTTTTTTSPPTTTTTTTPPTTTAPPPVGQFACIEHSGAPSIWEVRPPSDIPPPKMPKRWRRVVAGRTVQGREIEVLVRRAKAPRRRVVVIGGVHGNEPVTPPAVRGLLRAAIDPDVALWLVPVANPDGSAAGMRCNANGVDLNRNFSWEWRPNDGGPAPLSEPETQAVAALVERVRPDLVIWVHQPLGYVSAIGATSSRLEQAWSAATGLPVRPDVTQHGGGESWSAFVAGVPSMLVEIDGWEATPEVPAATMAGFESVLAALG